MTPFHAQELFDIAFYLVSSTFLCSSLFTDIQASPLEPLKEDRKYISQKLCFSVTVLYNPPQFPHCL